MSENAMGNVYKPEDIQVMLGIGRSSTYEFLRNVLKDKGPFRVLKIGRLLRIPKDSFDAWITGKAGEDG